MWAGRSLSQQGGALGGKGGGVMRPGGGGCWGAFLSRCACCKEKKTPRKLAWASDERHDDDDEWERVALWEAKTRYEYS